MPSTATFRRPASRYFLRSPKTRYSTEIWILAVV